MTTKKTLNHRRKHVQHGLPSFITGYSYWSKTWSQHKLLCSWYCWFVRLLVFATLKWYPT